MSGLLIALLLLPAWAQEAPAEPPPADAPPADAPPAEPPPADSPPADAPSPEAPPAPPEPPPDQPPRVGSVTVTPDPARIGQTLTCHVHGAEDPDGDPVTVTTTWEVDGAPSGTGETLSVTFRAGALVRCLATPRARDADGAVVASAPVGILNTPPTVAPPAVTPGEPTVSDTLRCTPGAATDADGDALSTSTSFAIAGAPAGQGDTLAGERLHKGDVVTCTVLVTDGTDATAATSPPVTVRNTPPVLVGVTLAPDAPRTGDVLRCEAGPTSDVDGDPVTPKFAWSIDGAVTDVTEAVLPADRTRKGAKIGCIATPHDGEADGAPIPSAVVVIANTPPTVASATLGPEGARKGDAIACTAGEATDADGDTVTLRRKWTLDGAPIEVRTTLVAPRRDAVVGCTVTPWDGAVEGVPVSAAPLTVRNAPPKATAARITPTAPRVGATLTCSADGLSDPDGDVATARIVCSVDGAVVGEGPTLSAGFRKGQTVGCQATPHDGTEAGAPLPPVAVLVVDSPPVVGEVALAPVDPDTNAILVATAIASDPDGEPVTLAWRWTVNGKPATGIEEKLDGVASFAHGDTVTVGVTATAGDARSAEAVATTVIRNTPPTRPAVALEDPSEAGALVCRVVAPSTDLDGDALTYQFAWMLDGREQTTKGQTDHKGDTVLATALKLGQEWTCAATAYDGRDRGPASEPDRLVIVEPSAAMGSSHACAIEASGFATCWGNRDYGLTETPPDRLRQVSVGGWHNCAVRQRDRSVVCWGHDVYGQSTEPPGAWREIAAGGWHTCGLDLDGKISCWGQSSEGRLDAPEGAWTALAAGWKHTCALDAVGAIRCWGADDRGQTEAPEGTFRQISAGESHTCALDATGNVTCWGDGEAGELDAPPGPFVQVVTGSRFSCALRADGTVSCWGFGDYGQLEVPAATFRRLGDGVDGLCGVTTDNAVVCWGRDQHGTASPPASLR